MLEIAKDWQDYELIDAGEEEKLERWGKYILRRPDPQAIWKRNPKLKNQWENPDMFYHRSNKGGGEWEINSPNPSSPKRGISAVPQNWQVSYKSFTFQIKPTA